MAFPVNIAEKRPFFQLTAAQLRFIALAAMLLDHLWATVIPGNQWLNYIGRLAFPIFAFQIAEGFLHTSHFRRYVWRLLLFACLSEIPFNLMYASSIIYPFHQNVMFTLLLGLLAIGAIHRARRQKTKQAYIAGAAGLLLACAAAGFGMTDYGAKGVLTVVMFYCLRGFPLARAVQIIAMVLLNMVFFQGLYVPVEFLGHTFEVQTQGIAVLALPLIWLYRGEKGGGGKALQYGSYAFYPAHMLVLDLIRSMV